MSFVLSWLLGGLGSLFSSLLLPFAGIIGTGGIGAVVYGAIKGRQLVIYAGIGIVLVCATLVALNYRAEAAEQQAQAQMAQNLLEKNQKALAIAQADKSNALKAIDALSTKVQTEMRRSASLKEQVRAIPRSTACVDSPVMRSYIGGLRAEDAAAGNPVPGAHPAGSPHAAVPTRAGRP